MSRLFIGLFGAALVAAPAFLLGAAETQPAPTAATAPAPLAPPRVVLLQMYHPPAANPDNRQLILSDDRYSSFQEIDAGIKIVLDIPMPPSVVEVPKSIILSSFVDDKNTDLGMGTRPKSNHSIGEDISPIALTPNGADCIFKIYSATFPDHEAAAIHIKSRLPVHVGQGEKTFTQNELPLRLGKTIDAGPLKLTIVSLSEPYRGQGPAEGLDITFTSPSSLNPMKTIEFLDENQKVIPFTNQTRSQNTEDSGNHLSSISGTLATRPHTVAVRVTAYDKIETLDIPLDVSIKIGL